MTARRLAAALLLLAGCAATPTAQPDTVTIARDELRTALLTLLAEHAGRVAAEKALAELREKSGCI